MTCRRNARHFALVASLVSSLTLGVLTLTPSGSAGSSTLPTGFYLDVGGSSSLGYQPTGTLTKDGALFDTPTNNGYANDVVKDEASKITLSLFKIGCPAESVETLLGEKDHCYKLPTTQMSIALRYLNAHHSETGIVSIDIGFNDVRPCLGTADVEVECADEARQAVSRYLPKIIAKLKSAAGPNVHFVGLEYEDPFLERFLEGSDERSYATQTLNVMTELNAELRAAYSNAGVAIADTPATFDSAVTTPTRMSDGDVVPENVAQICALTYMCRAYPWGPDDHPNNLGYQAIAREIVRVLPATWS
jgi:lysophospholipase L1-like esterase